MATSKATAIQVEGKMTVQAAIQQLVEIEVEEDKGDPFESMNNAQIADIYHRMKPEDPRLLRQFKSFHKLYYNLHGHLQKHWSIHRPLHHQDFLHNRTRQNKWPRDSHSHLPKQALLNQMSSET